MKDKELLAQLNKLSTISLRAEAKEANRRLLMAQITQGEELQSLGWLQRFNLAASRLLQPYPIAAMIVLFFVASGVVSWRVSANAQPGDSLYIAKRLSERTKMLMAFDEKSKTKLNVEFAGNRAKEISLLFKAEQPVAEQSVLQTEFKNELNQVKERWARLKKPATVSVAENKVEPSGAGDEFLSAGKDKNGQKIDIAVPKTDNQPVASSSAAGVEDVLEEAEKLFDSQNYDQAADKLGEVNKMLDEVK